MRKKEPFPQHVTAFAQLTDSFLSSSVLMFIILLGFCHLDRPSLIEAYDCKLLQVLGRRYKVHFCSQNANVTRTDVVGALLEIKWSMSQCSASFKMK